jgi:glutaminase
MLLRGKGPLDRVSLTVFLYVCACARASPLRFPFSRAEHDSFNLGSTRLRHLPGRDWGANDLVKNLELYFQCCSIQTCAEGQAAIGATLAAGGRCPLTDEPVFSGAHVRNCLSLMLSCGMYDYSGEWAYSIGLPAKSGVSGVLMVVVPGVGGLSVYSPPLDALGNTVRGIAFCRRLVEICCFTSFSRHVSGKVNPAAGAGAGQRGGGTGPGAGSSINNISAHAAVVALCALCARGDLTGIRALLSAGADANGADYDGRAPLHLAASEGQLAAVKYLCATSRLSLNPVDRWGNTPFSDAIRGGHVAVAEYLFAKLKQQGVTPAPGTGPPPPAPRRNNQTQ